MIISAKTLVGYAQDLKDMGLQGLDLPDDLRKEFIESADKVYGLSERMIRLERERMKEKAGEA